MPRSATHNNLFVLDRVLLWQYLRQRGRSSGHAILVDAFLRFDLAALDLVDFCLHLRKNRRTRRTLSTVRDAWFASCRGQGHQPRWLGVFKKTLLAQYRVMRRLSFPVSRGHQDESLTQSLPRSQRRQLVNSGTVVAELPALRDQASVALKALYRSLVGREVVLWVDNWYWERYTTGVDRQQYSQDLTVFAVLPLLTTTTGGPSSRTRSRTFEGFAGHVDVTWLGRWTNAASGFAVLSFTKLCNKVHGLLGQQLSGTVVRVPLDIHRPSRPRLQWRSFSLSPWRVGSTTELMRVLMDVCELQRDIRKPMPLLVDEKVHYSICRLMYNPSYSRWDVRGMLKEVPLLFGVWHPYKQTLAFIYRRYMPVMALLERQDIPLPGQPLKAARRVLFMEKMFACLLLLPQWLKDEVDIAMRVPRSVTTYLCVLGMSCASLVSCSPSYNHTLNLPLSPLHSCTE